MSDFTFALNITIRYTLILLDYISISNYVKQLVSVTRYSTQIQLGR